MLLAATAALPFATLIRQVCPEGQVATVDPQPAAGPKQYWTVLGLGAVAVVLTIISPFTKLTPAVAVVMVIVGPALLTLSTVRIPSRGDLPCLSCGLIILTISPPLKPSTASSESTVKTVLPATDVVLLSILAYSPVSEPVLMIVMSEPLKPVLLPSFLPMGRSSL